MIEAQRTWLINHLHEGHGLPGPDEAYESFADLKAAHDLLHESEPEQASVGVSSQPRLEETKES